MTGFALYYEPSAYSMQGRLMGRQSAGAAFLQAVANTRPERLWCYAQRRASAVDCAKVLSDLGANKTGIAWVGFQELGRLAEPGLLYRPDPRIQVDAWRRLAQSDQRAYSICGITHTISTHAVMETIASWLTAPLEAWDAVICTSRAGRDAIRYVLEQQADYLQERTGAQRFTLPQLPVIPLGVHAEHFSSSPASKAAARARLGVADDEVAVLYSGRLAPHAKAHPLPMYLALERAARGRKVVLIQAGKAPNPEIHKIFIDEPLAFCPSVRTVIVDGADFSRYRDSWAAADIFTSLSDNIQETFGLTPVEAMAAGLPVVVSDWNGYRDTVRNGVDGFRVPTLTLPPGRGLELADRYDLGVDSYDHYCGYNSQLVASDIEATANAYRLLFDSKDLRQRMGDAGAAHARDKFDWSIIFKQYEALWAELRERRRSDSIFNRPLTRRVRPDRADPFAMFATYSTFHVGANLQFRLVSALSLKEIVRRKNTTSMKIANAVQPNESLIAEILDKLSSRWKDYETIASELSAHRRENVASALVWLSKIGAVSFSVD